MNDFTIMLVDDDSDVLGAIGTRCRARGFNVLRAHNLLTAMSLIEVHHPDVLCVDVRMPTGNGLSFCESLAADAATKDIPIIVLTGQRDEETLRRCHQLGATYLPKRPDVWSDLEPLLDKLIERADYRKRANNVDEEVQNEMQFSVSDSSKLCCNSTCEKTSSVSFASSPMKAPPPIGHRSNPAQLLDSRTIVIADDDADLVSFLTQRCSQLGCRVIGAGSALEAINVIDGVTPDLVCIDVNMPAGSGLSVVEMMSSDQRLRAIPVIVLTGNSDQQTIRRCHNMMVYYVQKSHDVWNRIEPLLMELLGKPDATRASFASRSAQAAVAVGPSAFATLNETSTTTGVDSGDSLLDAVFAMLGNAGDELAITAALESEGVDAVNDEPPWVLCIDDDADFSDALKCRLESYGVAVIRAFSGMAGYRLAFTHPARAILLDYNMPDGRGDYILGRLKDNLATKDIPVIVITGVRDKWLERKMYGLGAKRFLTKPVKFDALRDELAHYIEILAEPAVV